MTDKLLKDTYEIFSYCEGGRESLPKSLLKDNSQTAFDTEAFATSVQETIKASLTYIKTIFAAEIQKCCDEMSSIDFGIYLHVIFHLVFTFMVQSPQNLWSNPYNENRKMGRKNFSFGIYLHDKNRSKAL